jgi:hypothetical protein
MRLSIHVIAACVTLSALSCAGSYQQQQAKLRERYTTGCRVLNDPPARQAPDAISIPASAISKNIERSHDELLTCYLEAVEMRNGLAGRVVIDFTVRVDGSVADPAVAMSYSSISDPTVGCCIARVAQTWKFPAPPDNKPFQVAYPFDLMTGAANQRYDAPKASIEYRGQFPGTLLLTPSLAPNATDLRSVW